MRLESGRGISLTVESTSVPWDSIRWKWKVKQFAQAEFYLWCCLLRRMNLEAQQWWGA